MLIGPLLKATTALAAAVKEKRETIIESMTVILSGKCDAGDLRPCRQQTSEPGTIKLSPQLLVSAARTPLQHPHLEVEISHLIGTQDHHIPIPHKLEDMRDLRLSRNTLMDQIL